MLFSNTLVFLRGGGDLATGAALRLAKTGFPLVISELPQPLVVRRRVAFATAVLEGAIEVEGVRAECVRNGDEIRARLREGVIPVVIDANGDSIDRLEPQVVIDGRMTKDNRDARWGNARLAIALGPGFTAGRDCDAVIETNRGHFLGRVYWTGEAEPDTGTPDIVKGRTRGRVLRAPAAGVVRCHAEIGDAVVTDQLLATIDGMPILASFHGVLRGIIADGTTVPDGIKIGDLDPRGRREYCFTVSDKSLAVGGGVLEAILSWLNGRKRR